jgi:hypothetical protein
LSASLSLITVSSPGDVTQDGAWLRDPSKRASVAIALNLVPFAGIAFLWFVGVIRDRIGDREDKFFATVFLGSGLLFVAMLFVAAAVGGAMIATAGLHPPGATSPSELASGREITSILLRVYALRMAGVFTLSTATILYRSRVAPRWIAVLGFAAAVVLLITVGLSPWVFLLFPAWIALVSIETLIRSFRAEARGSVLPAGGAAGPG